MNQTTITGIPWQEISIGLGYFLMALLTWLGAILYKDVRFIKENWVTRQDLAEKFAKSDGERDVKHVENTGNFRRVEDRIVQMDQKHNESQLAIERRLGALATQIASLRTYGPPQEGPERRSGS